MTGVDPLDFAGRAVLVTGGTSGIGNAIARAFRDRGAAVAVTGRRAAANYDADLADMRFHQLDVTDEGAMTALAETTEALDVLVNSAAMVAYRGEEFNLATFRRVVDVNLNALMHGATLYRERLAERQGCIINIASLASFSATRGNPAYGASKAGVSQLTKSLAVAYARDRIRVNAIAPGWVATRMTAVSHENEKISAEIVKRTPLGRWASGEDMAGAALFLASPLAGFVTGQTLVVDGGYSLAI